jgi:hypothetical protein
MKYSQFDAGKNDFFFAFVMVAMFAVTVVSAVAGYVDFAGGAGEQHTQVARAGAVK